MEIIRHNTGKDKGEISVVNTIATMDVGEVWYALETEVVREYARNACSRYSKQTGRVYNVSSTRQQRGIIKITRVK